MLQDSRIGINQNRKCILKTSKTVEVYVKSTPNQPM